MKHCTAKRIVFFWLVVLFGCAADPGPCPKDRELIDRFRAAKAQLEALKDNPENGLLREKLGIRGVLVRSGGPLRIWFDVWFKDFVGPGGVAKGYAYCEQTPQGLVENIDEQSEPGSPEYKMLYRRIEGPWYLYYRSDN